MYCRVKLRVKLAINIWAGLPSNETYNGRFMSIGGGASVSLSLPHCRFLTVGVSLGVGQVARIGP